MKLLLTTVLAVAALSSCSIVKPSGDNFELLILHNNDMHARFEQTSQRSGACTTADREAGKCYGGFPRVAHVVKEARRAAQTGEGPPVLYLNAGDTYTGTAWFTIYKWKIAAEFVNALQPDAVSLGNNEVEQDSSVSPLLKNINTQILASNVILKATEEMKNVQKSIVFDLQGVKVGVIGYLTPEAGILDSSGNVEYIDEILALTEEVAKLQTQSVNIIIALGHSTVAKDMEIAKEVVGLDMIIAGNKNTFYWDGRTVSNDEEHIIVTQESGKKVPIILSTAYDKYLGSVKVKFDADGEIVEYNDSPILLDSTVTQDLPSLDLIKKYNSEFATRSEVLGNTAVVLDAESCSLQECNFGNFVTDAIMYYYATRHAGDNWTDAPIAIIHSGAIGASIAPTNRPAAVTTADVLSALPIESNLVAVTMNGRILTQVLEHSVSDYNQNQPTGQFLQFSGIRAEFDLEKEPGSRLVNAVVRCWECFVPEFYTIDEWRNYKVLMPAALANGQFGYSMLVGLTREVLVYDEVTCTSEFITLRTPVYPEVAGRISLGNHELDNGVSGLTPFIEALTCPVLAANLNLARVPELLVERNLMDSIVFDINGTRIGVIGYLTPDTQFLAIRNDIKYIEEVTAIKKEAAKLKNRGVNILIALGHSGFTKDLEIAEKVEDIDLVIGGHTNTFLWNGTSPDIETPEGPYPTLVKQKSGRFVPAVQAYAYTKYLGKLHIIFDSQGEIVSFNGNPILLDKSIPQDPSVLEIVNRYRADIRLITEQVVGTTPVVLDGDTCRLRECNMGNLITDAMVERYAADYNGTGWTDAPIAIMQGGGIRSSIAHIILPANITKGDLLRVMPFDGNLVKLTLNGRAVRKMLEHSVAKYYPARPPGPFLQMSGIKVEYDFRNYPGLRVVDVHMRCGNCLNPEYSVLNYTAEYNILMPAFLAMGGDGYSSLGNHEFDNGVSGLTPFIENLTCPVLTANLVLTKVPELAKETNLKKSIVLEVAGHKIGIVGYLTPDTKVLAVPNDVEYSDEIEAIKKEVKKLQEDGISIIIGLGHSGFLKDLEIAKEVDGIDLVIGGHTNTFLWNGTSPDSEEAQGPYPTYVTQASGRRVPVVQAYAYTKYLGKLHIIFDANGEIISIDGIPILLDNSIPQDPDVVRIINKYRDGVLNITEDVLGYTSVILDGSSCHIRECNLGNLITDAMVFRYAVDYTGEHWTDAPIALIQGGGIRSSVAHAKMPANITKGDLLTVMPFDGQAVAVTMNGSILLQMIEHSCLGNHEFDEAVDGVIPFIRNLSAPVLAANLILDKVPALRNEPNLYNSIVITKNRVKIGIIGYLTPETKYLAPRNDVEYEDEIPALRREVKKLKEQDVNILIALGHSGFVKDLKIAQEVEDLDLVIGGHSNTFLLNNITTTEMPEERQGPYPVEVTQADGRIVRVVQAYAYTKYMGKLHLIFDSQGEIIECDGDPILLNQDIPRDPELLVTINKYREDMDRISNEVVGQSYVFLEGDCRLRECNLGDLIADAMLNYTREKYQDQYPDVNIALVQGGRIRSSIDHSASGTPFSLTRGDWITVLPFSDTLAIVTMNGTVLKQSLEHSVSTWRVVDSTGQFQQFSGMQVAYDLAKPVGSRVVKAKAVCSNCGDYTLQDIQDDYEYKMMMPSFLANGGDGYTMFTELFKETLVYNELNCVLHYIGKYSPINQQLDGRIKILNEDKVQASEITSENQGRGFPSSGVVIQNSLKWYYVLIIVLVSYKYSFVLL
ncbi:trifunctional nucleotide phosphoesterase protein YfkN-like [Anticarsia gemmatalis]|uniref:trifunctional nucleotide phosphoesterase protein YfkN-like n=1 Tax=Anticarsia gemmatalis TaxID=129554 RepID=UPI003F75F94D